MYTPLVLLSGGMDSSTLLAHALVDPNEPERVVEGLALFVDYGQRHIRERESARAVASYYGVELIELDLRAYGASVASALTSPEIVVPHGHYTAASMHLTVVPNRNAVMLAAAAGIASSRGCSIVVTAVHSGDHAVYPDCHPEFILAVSAAYELGCGVGVVAPFVGISKADIARKGASLGVPYSLTWSCYEGGQPGDPDQHCGRCGTCVERAEAFALAGVTDPTNYADPDFWRAESAAHA